MNKNFINENNCDKFIFKGSLALESYFDDTQENKELFDSFNNKLKEYRSLNEKSDIDKESIANALLSTIEQMGGEKFTVYDDGDVEYNYVNNKGDEFSGK